MSKNKPGLEMGPERTERALDLLDRKGLKTSVVTLPEGYKDPDEVINGNKEKGLPALKIEVFRELVGNPESGARWKAKRFLSKQSKNGEHNTDRVKGLGKGGKRKFKRKEKNDVNQKR